MVPTIQDENCSAKEVDSFIANSAKEARLILKEMLKLKAQI